MTERDKALHELRNQAQVLKMRVYILEKKIERLCARSDSDPENPITKPDRPHRSK